jgi:hypothetical protein
MTYQKPELNVLGNAEVAILGVKPLTADPDNGIEFSVAAYEVDE